MCVLKCRHKKNQGIKETDERGEWSSAKSRNPVEDTGVKLLCECVCKCVCTCTCTANQTSCSSVSSTVVENILQDQSI